ncbi:unnamed protein product, partial [marine sediment metagenome]
NLYAFMSSKNAGLEDLSQGRIKVHSEMDFKEIIDYCKLNSIDFVVVGPEAPLVVGIVDAIERNGIPCIGPRIEAAQLEGSKIFTRRLLEKYKISSNIKSKKFDSMENVENYIKDLGVENVVVKPDGLTGGKGVLMEPSEDDISKIGKTYTGSLAAKKVLKPDEEAVITFYLAWNFPNRFMDWRLNRALFPDTKTEYWIGNRYNEWFNNSIKVIEYVKDNWSFLLDNTFRFHEVFFYSTLPPDLSPVETPLHPSNP